MLSPPARAVEQTLRFWLGERGVGVGPNAGVGPAKVQVLSYTDHFGHLWGLDEQESPLDATTERTLVLVYDGVPGGEGGGHVPISTYVTAYDWLVYALLTVSARDEKKRPPLRVFLLDLVGRRLSTTFGARILPAFLPRLPWVRTYRLFSLTEAQRPFGTVSVGYWRLVQDILTHNKSPQPRANGPHACDLERDLRQLWAAELSRAETRHDVSNVVAPLLLVQGIEALNVETVVPPQIKDHPQRDALRSLLDALILSPPVSVPPLRTTNQVRQDSGQEEPAVAEAPLRDGEDEERFAALEDEPFIQRDVFGRFGGPVNVLLVDDDAQEGYEDVVRAVLGERMSRFALSSQTTPDTLFGWLEWIAPRIPDEPASAQEAWSEPRILGAAEGTPEGLTRFDVLLLDLRLFTGEGGKEQAFLEKLMGFYVTTRAADLGDPQLSVAYEAALARIAALSQSGEGQQRAAPELRHIALLPLLLSHADPSLPIVLFSSTRQRKLLEAFAHRPNIITTFSKPIVSGSDERFGATDAVHGLRAALLRALELHECRVAWNTLPNLDWRGTPAFGTPVRVPVAPCESCGRAQGVWVDQLWNQDDPEREHSPSITGADLRRLLASMYADYIQRGRYYDFLSVPWELIEGSLTPADEEEGGLKIELRRPNDPRSKSALAIQFARHLKVHGQVIHGRNLVDDGPITRWISVLLLLLLEDFIDDAREVPVLRDPSRAGSQKAFYNALCPYPGAGPRRGEPPSPNKLLRQSKLSWSDRVLYAMLAEIGGYSGVGPVPCRAVTFGALQEVARLRIERLRHGPGPPPSA